MTLRVVPVELADANAFIARLHRHHPPVVGSRFNLGAVSDGILLGVATVGRPVARRLDHRRIVEVNRLCSDGTPHVCSALYGAAARVAKEWGFLAIITYTLDAEPGTSLIASGWWGERGAVEAGSWGCASRPRNTPSLGSKTRWLKMLNEWVDLPAFEVEVDPQLDLLQSHRPSDT